MKLNTPIVIGIVVVVFVLGVGAFVLTNPVLASRFGLERPSAPTSGMASTTPGRFGGMRGGFAMGSIEVLNDNGFTLTLSDGTTKDVTLSATTTIQNYASASSTPTTITADQLSVGEQVSVIGSANADGSITARSVRTGAFPTMRMGGTGGQSRGNRAPMNGQTPPTGAAPAQ